MNPPLAYQNGQFVPAGQLSVPIHDAGFVWGATVSDRVRTFNGRLFRLDEHIRRFRKSCASARVPLIETDAQLSAVSERLAEINRGERDLSVVWIATPGPLANFAAAASSELARPALIVYTLPIDPTRSARLLNSGIGLVSVPAGNAVDPRIKHRSRLGWWIANEKTHERDPDAHPLFLDPQTRYVLETPTSNLLAVIDGQVISPPTGSVLEGVSLGVVKELCERLGLRFWRDNLEREDLSDASEILLTNTTDCVAGVSRLDDEVVPFPGPVLSSLLDAWSELVGVDMRRPA
jgi:branched-subunit amino acid aminotransferase/4-amino-4-deoxychorismate lyase